MRILELEENLDLLNFPLKKGFSYGFNIFRLKGSRGDLIIDTAFRSQVREVIAVANISRVVISHFHNDHVSGLLALPSDLPVHGSPRYAETLGKDIPQKVIPVDFDSPLPFEDHELRFIPSPGHSTCSIFTDIDGRWLHVGDNLMGRYDGKRIIPWVMRKDIPEHISSLELLRGMQRDRVIPSHGPVLTGAKRIREEIDLRLFYLERMLDPSAKLTLEEALPDSPENWVGSEHFQQLMEESSDRK